MIWIGIGLTHTINKGVGGPSYDADAEALFARYTAPATVEQKALSNTAIVDLKAAGIWSKLDCLYFLNGWDEQSSTRNWKQDAYNLTKSGSPVFEAGVGVTGGSPAYLNTGFNPVTAGGHFAQDDHSFGTWCVTDATSSSMVDMGSATTGTTNLYTVPHRADATIDFYASDTTSRSAGAIATAVGLTAVSRRSSTSKTCYKNGAVKSTNTATSAALPNRQIYILAANNGSAVLHSTRQVSFSWLGGGLTDTQHADFYSIASSYLSGISDAMLLSGLMSDGSRELLAGMIDGGTHQYLSIGAA